jgi:CheY-like chemotaxis protein
MSRTTADVANETVAGALIDVDHAPRELRGAQSVAVGLRRSPSSHQRRRPADPGPQIESLRVLAGEPLLLSTTAGPRTRGLVVLAEDDEATRFMLCHVLTQAGFTVKACDNGQLACEAVRQERPDVVLLDWTMPAVDGLHAVKLLKADVATRAIPIVMITAHSQIDDRAVAIGAGVQDFVAKPFDVDELLTCIDQQMRWREIITTACAVSRRGPVTTRASPAPRSEARVS